ncbi:unnamed protein product [Phaeothamnion confervicola]
MKYSFVAALFVVLKVNCLVPPRPALALRSPFSVSQTSLARIASRRRLAMSSNEEEKEEQFSVDWDAELKKLSSGALQPGEQPKGLDDVSEREVQAYRLQKQVSSSFKEVRRSVPSWKQLQKDQRFWLGLLVGVSFLLAILSAMNREELIV